jgi:hypothetical protein
MPKNPRFELRLPPHQVVAMKRTAKARGFRSANAYVQSVLSRDLRGAEDEDTDRDSLSRVLIGFRKKSAHCTQLTRRCLLSQTASHGSS